MKEIEAFIECEDVEEAYRAFADDTPFPRVTHIAIGAIFGAQDRFWQPVANIALPLGKAAEKGILQLNGFLARMPLKVHCGRGAFGPLSPPPVIEWGSFLKGSVQVQPRKGVPIFTTTPTFVFHYELFTPFPSIVLGCPTRFVLETADRAYDCTLVDETTGSLAVHMIQDRSPSLAVTKNTTIDLDWYASSQRIGAATDKGKPAPSRGHVMRCGDEKERSLVKEVEKRIYEMIKDHRVRWVPEKGDKLRVLPWMDAPPCEGCCWQVDRTGPGDQGQVIAEYRQMGPRR